VFSVALSVAPRVAAGAPRRYLAAYPVEPGLSSTGTRERARVATIRPAAFIPDDVPQEI